MKNYYLGIDPGKQGAFVVINESDKIIYFKCMPVVESEISLSGIEDILLKIKSKCKNIKTVLENPIPFHKCARKSIMKQGKNYGIIKGMCYAYKLNFMEVEPNTWHKRICTGFKDKLNAKDKALLTFENKYGYSYKQFGDIVLSKRDKDKINYDIFYGLMDAALLAQYAKKYF